jgi:hypothetical protein
MDVNPIIVQHNTFCGGAMSHSRKALKELRVPSSHGDVMRFAD